MGYLIFQILVFLAIAALLGFAIGWFMRDSTFKKERQAEYARWRSKFAEVEGERDRFVNEVTQANETKAKYEASATEAHRLAETHEASLQQLRREHETKLGLLSKVEGRVGGLETDLSTREKELVAAKEALSKQTSLGSGSGQFGKELSAATERANALERDLQRVKGANIACKSKVEALEAQLATLKRGNAGGTGSSGALGLRGSTGSVGTGSTGSAGGASGGAAGSAGGVGGASGGAAGSAGSAGGASGGAAGSAGGVGGASGGAAGSAGGAGGASGGAGGASGGAAGSDTGVGGVGNTSGSAGGTAGGGALGLIGGTDTAREGHGTASPSYLTGKGSQSVSGSGASGATDGDDDEGVRPEALSAARGGVADDLKKISGVGPKLEKTLNGLGIYHFAQIAAFTPDNVAWVDRHLRFKGRIERENWIEQAKVLAAGGETEFSRRS